MKIIITALAIGIITFGYAQDTLKNSNWGFVNRYRLTTYAFSFFDNAISQFKAGSEIQVELVSYKRKRHEFAFASGFFFINVKARLPENRSMQYFYFPINLNYRLYSKSRNVYGEFSLGRPLLTYEDSKYFAYDKFWLGYEDAIYDPNIIRKRIWGIHSIKFGYCIGKHISLTAGEMSYMFSTYGKKYRNMTRLSFGIEYRI